MRTTDALAVMGRFATEGTALSCERYGNGHIHETYCVSTDTPVRYLLQKLNTAVFPQPVRLMENIRSVTEYLQTVLARQGSDPLRETLTLIPAHSGLSYADEGERGFWRCYRFIEDTVSYDRATPAVAYESARAFGRFQRLLADYPAGTLHETIPGFHDTPARLRRLRAAAEADALGRLASVRRELQFIEDRAEETGTITRALESGALPLRVTHNDTKLNNVLFEAATGRGLCVVDLDTVMPGSAVYDFGDSVRTGAATAAEDEPDASAMRLEPEHYRQLKQGYLEESPMTETERELMAWGAKLITLETGIRFLTDYLEGDVYFRIHRPGHNLDRCRTQLALAADMERQWDRMNEK